MCVFVRFLNQALYLTTTCYSCRAKGIIGRVFKFVGYIHHYKSLYVFGLISFIYIYFPASADLGP